MSSSSSRTRTSSNNYNNNNNNNSNSTNTNININYRRLQQHFTISASQGNDSVSLISTGYRKPARLAKVCN